MRSLALALVLIFPLAAHAQLNDTGQIACYDASTDAVDCSASVGGDGGLNPGQDARYGRDPMAGAGTLTKTGGGDAGFDFTALDASGNPTTPGAHACVRDNITRLIWSTESLSLNWNGAATAATRYSRCGQTSGGWRVPTRRELLSIVHHGTHNPAIDTAYFPNTASSYYWSSDTASSPIDAWVVYFNDGDTYADGKIFPGRVRLVRSGQ